MSTSIIITAFISVIMTSFVAVFNILIYKKATGASKAYYFWALMSMFMLFGAIISFASSFFMDPNAKELSGTEGIISVILLSSYFFGYYYLALGATFLPAELDIININLERFYNLRKFVFLGVLVLSSFVAILLGISDNEIPVRMFYVPSYTLIWLYCIFIILPFYRTVKNYAKYWLYLLLAAIFGFIGNLFEILAFFIHDQLIVMLPICYAIMGITSFLGFYKLGKDLQAF